MDSHQSFPRYSIARFMRAAQETSGSELVEIAVSIPIFLMIILATFQFAIIMFNYESAGFAVRQAARYGSTHSLTSLNPCTTAQITSMTQSSLWSPTGSSTVTVSWPNGNSVGNTILVSVSESYSVGMFNSSFSSINISNSMQYAIMR
jgi:Flp pilus assembly protein TadG